MKRKGMITEMMNGGRIVSHGRIDSLDTPFNLSGCLFTLYLRPKSDPDESDVLVNVLLQQDDAPSEAPFPVGDWSPMAVTEVAGGQSELLENYDIYWGSGENVSHNTDGAWEQ